jgi:NAD(P)-dependent dehydrogenase (short-subunit alcohol dehydrogenase family)
MKARISTIVFCLFITYFVRRHQAMSTAPTTNTMRRVLVTGANKGIGKAICERLLTEWKDTHVLLASRDLQRGEEAIQDLIVSVGQDCQDRLELIHLDTSSDESVAAAAEKLAGEGKLYGIVNNAGVSPCLGEKVCTTSSPDFDHSNFRFAFSDWLWPHSGRDCEHQLFWTSSGE